MKRCEVLIPFHMIATDTIHVPGDIIEVSDKQLAKILAIHRDMVVVLEDVKPNTKKRAEKPHNGECTAQS
jgi:hypothetical protein